jgi:hypothetical protein
MAIRISIFARTEQTTACNLKWGCKEQIDSTILSVIFRCRFNWGTDGSVLEMLSLRERERERVCVCVCVCVILLVHTVRKTKDCRSNCFHTGLRAKWSWKGQLNSTNQSWIVSHSRFNSGTDGSLLEQSSLRVSVFSSFTLSEKGKRWPFQLLLHRWQGLVGWNEQTDSTIQSEIVSHFPGAWDSTPELMFLSGNSQV